MNARRVFLAGLAVAPLPAFLPSAAAGSLAAGQPSRTALSTAQHRAAHQLLERPVVFEDPIALRIIGSPTSISLVQHVNRYGAQSSRSLRAHLVARSRLAEDELARGYRQGVRQYLVLGAGLDTFAYRNPYADLKVFEVDHPSTQAWKREQLRNSQIEPPASLTFVPVDFETQSLAARLTEAGFRMDLPVVVSWLGVSMYLTRDAVMGTLQLVARRCALGSSIVFDYLPTLESLDPLERPAHLLMAESVARIGEPWISRFDTQAFVTELRELGFSRAQSLGTTELNARYFADRSDGFRIVGSSQIMVAGT